MEYSEYKYNTREDLANNNNNNNDNTKIFTERKRKSTNRIKTTSKKTEFRRYVNFDWNQEKEEIMAPRGLEPRTPDFMKIGFFEHILIYSQVILTLITYLLLMTSLGIMYLTTGVKVDTTQWDINQIIATGKIIGK